MAIYHFSAQILGRGQGRKNLDGSPRKTGDNAVAAAAYRAGEKLRDEANGKTHDYSNRQGVAYSEIVVPDGAPLWLADRQRLWSKVEELEIRKDAQLAREINIALPHELNLEQQKDLVGAYVRTQFVSLGMVADYAIHQPVPEKGDDPRNVHAHIMLTLRRATPEGLDPVKTRGWNSRKALDHWRDMWALTANQALRQAGRTERIDHRSLAEQRERAQARGDMAAAKELDRAPEIHIGPRPKAMHQRNVEPVSRTRQVGRRQAGRPERQTRFSPAAVQYYAKHAEDGRIPPDAQAQAELRLAAAKRRWAYQKRQRDWEREKAMRADRREAERQARLDYYAERDRQREEERKDRDKRKKQMGQYRTRDYPKHDRGPRVGMLWKILAGNNAKLKADIARIDAQSARMNRWMDYYATKAVWWLEGNLAGSAHRYRRWRDAQTEREKRAAAQAEAARCERRAAMLRGVLNELSKTLNVLMLREEHGIQRRRQIERGWGREVGRELDRQWGRGRSRQR